MIEQARLATLGAAKFGRGNPLQSLVALDDKTRSGLNVSFFYVLIGCDRHEAKWSGGRF